MRDSSSAARNDLTPEQVQLILDAIERPQVKALAYLMYDQHLRFQECLHLRWCDIDWNADAVTVAVMRNKTLTLPLKEPVKAALLDLKKLHEALSTDRVFAFTLHSWADELSRIGVQLGVALTPVDLRRAGVAHTADASEQSNLRVSPAARKTFKKD